MSQEPAVELRAIRAEEHKAWQACMGTAFGRRGSEEAADRIRKIAGYEWTLGAFAGDEVVGTAEWFPFDVTMPGLRTLPAASVIAVTVLPSHRRRGILRAMMHRQLADIRAAGVPLAILTASEGAIYGRFGYGSATNACTYEIDKRLARLARPVAAPGVVRVVPLETAEMAAPPLFDAMRALRPGECSVPSAFWYEYFHDTDWRGIDERRHFWAVYEHDGVVEGLADYHISPLPEDSRERAVEVELLVTSTPAAYEALVAYLLGIDLTVVLRLRHRPADEPLRHMLTDHRKLRMTRFTDDLWLRPLDVRAVLAARDYAAGAGGAGALRLLVHDSLFADNEGVYEVGADGSVAGPLAAGAPDAGAPDLELDVAALGSVVLGGRRFGSLVRGGRAIEHVAVAAWRADAMFLPETEPFATISF